jgi:vancomycin resistance protein YoaR
VIHEGEFVEGVGGGVSQMATTLFNAAFFAGLPIDTHQPHSYYISRYPMGREATVSMPAPDLVFTNNTEHGILVRTRATGSEVTVTFYSTDTGVKVTAEEPRILATRQPEVEQTTDPEKVTEGHVGYDVEVYRVIEFPDGRVERERFFTRYKVQNVRVLAT